MNPINTGKTTFAQTNPVFPTTGTNLQTTTPMTSTTLQPGFSSAQNILHVQLPTEIVQKPTAVHEQIRRERVEEIQPVVNIEKFQTKVVQVTQPLIDKEIRSVSIQERTLPSQVLPDVVIPTRQIPVARDVSTVNYVDERGMTVEKPAIFQEVDKTKIIEEIQPVIYKETIVPSIIHETKPVYQKIVEGTTYIHETLPPMQLHGSQYRYPETLQTTMLPTSSVYQTGSNLPLNTGLNTGQTGSNLPLNTGLQSGSNLQSSGMPTFPGDLNKPVLREATSTTTTTTGQNVLPKTTI